MFLIFVNDIFNCVNNLDVVLYADDATFVFKHKNIDTIFNVVNNELSNISQWASSNRLLVNIRKTKYMLINNCKKIDIGNNTLSMNNVVIENVKSFKFLGIIIDDRFSFKEHISYIENKVSKSIGIIKRFHFLPSNVLRNLYFSIIHSYLSYGNVIWGSTAPSNLMSLSLLNKKNYKTHNWEQLVIHNPTFV